MATINCTDGEHLGKNGKCCDRCPAGQSTHSLFHFFLWIRNYTVFLTDWIDVTAWLFCMFVYWMPFVFSTFYQDNTSALTVTAIRRQFVPNVQAGTTQPLLTTCQNVANAWTAVEVHHTHTRTQHCIDTHIHFFCSSQNTQFLPLLPHAAFYKV